MNSTWRMLPSAKAPMNVAGTMFIRNGTKPMTLVCLT
ncbi:hypothetical protein ABH977_005551 [Bradyrhizobium ottawaense]